MSVWRDSWLIQTIINFFSFLVGKNLTARLQAINDQILCQSLLQPEEYSFVRILVAGQADTGTIKIADLYIGGSDSIGQSDSLVAYTTLMNFQTPQWFQFGVSKQSKKLLEGKDFVYYPDRDVIEFNIPLSQQGLTTTLAIVKGQLVECYELWGVYRHFASCMDRFTGILELPKEWLWKYPGAVQAAWSIKQNGANERDVKRLIGAVAGCTYSTVSGIASTQGSQIKIGDKTFKGKGKLLVKNHAFVEQDTKLFSGDCSDSLGLRYPAIYTNITGFPAQVPGLHVLTDVGILFADNSNYNIVNNILPLRNSPGGNFSLPYKQLCLQRAANNKVPYATLPASLNPAKYIFQTVWGASGVLIMTPPANQKDILLAIKFIVDNSAVGTIVVAYRYSSTGPVLLYPDINTQQQIMVYYNRSVNNGTSYRQRYGDFIE